MQLGKIKPAATIVAQFAAGVEVEAIQHDGKIFMPIVSMGEFATKEEPKVMKKEEPKSEPKSESKVEAKSEGATDKKFTEDELMDMESKELLKILKSYDIDPDDTEGKNTNKKLRLLILDAQKSAKSAKGDDDEDATPKKGKPAKEAEKDDDDKDDDDDDTIIEDIKEILDDFDEGKKNKKKTISAILDLYEDTTDNDRDTVTELVGKFENDAKADSEKMAAKINAALMGEDDKKEELVAPEDLEEGDKVSVYWNDDNKEWYNGTVKSISKKGKVLISYEDDTEEVIDPEVHTKIKLLK